MCVRVCACVCGVCVFVCVRVFRVLVTVCNHNIPPQSLNPICHLLALLGAHHIFHVSGLRVNVFVVLMEMLCFVI